MKKSSYNITFLLLILCSSVIYAQRFNGGVTAGLNATQLDGDHHAGYNKLGFSGGAFVNTQLNDNWGAQLELIFTQKGSKASDSLKYYESRMNYIAMPFLINKRVKEKFIAEIGLGLGYLLSAYEDKDGYGYRKAEPEFFNFELSGHAGFGYFLSEKFLASLRFTYSILPVREAYPGYHIYIERGQYNNVFTIGLYYKI